MVTLRCTQKLLHRLPKELWPTNPVATKKQPLPVPVVNPVAASLSLIAPANPHKPSFNSVTSATAAQGEAAGGEAALGDWYGTLLFTRPAHLVLCLSEPSRLCVVLPARDFKTLLPRWREATRSLLQALDAPADAVTQEWEQMQSVTVSTTSGGKGYRSALGTLKEFCWMVQERCWEGPQHPMELSLFLSGILCSPLQMRFTREAALALLEDACSR